MKGSKITKYVSFVIAILEISVLLIVGTYAWFSDRNTPTITGTNIKISSAEGLVIKLNPDSPARTLVDLNEVLSSEEEFALRQMSSSDAVNFYTIDFGAGLAFSKPSFYKLEPNEVTGTIDSENGIVDYNFYLQTEDMAKSIYFHKDTSLEGIAADAVRVAITVNTGTENIKIIFGNDRENGITDEYTTKAVISEGDFNYNNIDAAMVTNQLVYNFSDYDGGRTTSDSDPIDLSKILFTMPALTQYKVNVKIWLEGGDVDCVNEISDSVVNAVIKFGSANVLRDAPVLSANNSLKTINGLTTEMEYSLTYDANSEWIKVTDPDMVFERGKTYYVRYTAVENVSLESYATTVTFN